MKIRAILWDFGDTLADERWMRAPLEGVPDWPEIYSEFVEADLAHRNPVALEWMIGATTADDVASELGRIAEVNAGKVRAHMDKCCREVTFYPRVDALTQRCALPQAVVTINPDIFSTVIVPAYDLDARFQPIVTSWEERTRSKADICDIAIERFDQVYERGECLLVDNVTENVADWRDRGGAAYHFTGERTLYEAFDDLLKGGT
jgi:phosphoglycolate phosphatase-like HAD superfamily hydrolase